jgi:hypothetical protein
MDEDELSVYNVENQTERIMLFVRKLYGLKDVAVIRFNQSLEDGSFLLEY